MAEHVYVILGGFEYLIQHMNIEIEVNDDRWIDKDDAEVAFL